jgi:hypothetical protein
MLDRDFCEAAEEEPLEGTEPVVAALMLECWESSMVNKYPDRCWRCCRYERKETYHAQKPIMSSYGRKYF